MRHWIDHERALAGLPPRQAMTGDEFEARIDAIIATYPPKCHAAHRAMDLLTNALLIEMGGGYARGTAKWMAAIEGDHAEGNPYPLGVGA